jgi:hypothetical protein
MMMPTNGDSFKRVGFGASSPSSPRCNSIAVANVFFGLAVLMWLLRLSRGALRRRAGVLHSAGGAWLLPHRSLPRCPAIRPRAFDRNSWCCSSGADCLRPGAGRFGAARRAGHHQRAISAAVGVVQYASCITTTRPAPRARWGIT